MTGKGLYTIAMWWRFWNIHSRNSVFSFSVNSFRPSAWKGMRSGRGWCIILSLHECRTYLTSGPLPTFYILHQVETEHSTHFLFRMAQVVLLEKFNWFNLLDELFTKDWPTLSEKNGFIQKNITFVFRFITVSLCMFVRNTIFSHNYVVFSLARDLILEPDDVLHQSFQEEVLKKHDLQW